MSIFGSRSSPQDIAATLGAFVNQCSESVRGVDPEWFDRNSEAMWAVDRYFCAFAWSAADVSIQSRHIAQPEPTVFMQAFRFDRFSWLCGSPHFTESGLTDEGLWQVMYDDADLLMQTFQAPETLASGQPFSRIAKDWFSQRAELSVFDLIPTASAIGLITASSQLSSGIDQFLSKATR